MNNSKSKIKLLLIENNRILRDGMTSMFKPYKDLQVVAEAGNRESTIFKIHKSKPDVILIDLWLRSQNSLRVVEVATKDFPEVKVILMDLVLVKADILQLIKAGACGFILKDAPLNEFLNTIRAVAKGEKILPDYLTESLFSQIIDHAVHNDKKGLKYLLMTKREKEVVSLISNSFTNNEIAKGLNISELTVKSHVHHILEKLALHSRLEIANYAFKDTTSEYRKI
ncbi:MAG: response regulator transcription factor [Bacteroidota bacterium]|nr:response regulator transcription factor [Bacteroidota bacterium]